MKVVLKYIIAFSIMSFIIKESAAQNLNYTIKSGPAINQVQIFLTPDANYGSTVIQQMTLVVGWESSCADIAPFVTWDDGPGLINPFANSTYSQIDKTGTGTIAGVAYSYAEHTWSRTAGDFAIWQGGTEYLLATVTFNEGKPFCPISLLDFDDAGSTGSANVYVLDHLGNYFTPQYLNSGFYAVPGISSTSNGANGLVATTTALISLPVALKNFEARASDDCNVKLNWQTTSEQNSLRFVIQRSTNGSNWQSIGSVAAAGSSNSSRNYSFIDRTTNSAHNYYRLLQEDMDGKETYSSVITVRLDCRTEAISIRPTVSSSEVEIFLPEGFEKARIALVNMAGQVINIPGQSSGLYRTLRIDHLPSGIYMVNVVNSDGRSASEKIVKR